MPTAVDSKALEEVIRTSKEMGSFDYRDEADDDNYIVAAFYRTSDGRHFRVIRSSGMNSRFAGAGNFGEWLDDEERLTWNQW